ncbi:MAG: Fe-S cluster assembly protein IscX [Phycisphaerae bacterium]|jgi:FeS assembly protein IscX
MPPSLKWTDTEDIALLLHENFPDVDPLTVRFTDLRDRVCGLADFGDKPEACSEGKLEAIQMAWLEEYRGG